jgi:hypothetical protein
MALNIPMAGSSVAKGPTLPFEQFVSDLARELGSEQALQSLGDDFTAMLYKGFDAVIIRNMAMAEFSPAGILRLVAIGALRGSAAVSLKVSSGGDGDLHRILIPMKTGGSKTVFQLYQGHKLYAEKNSKKTAGRSYIGDPCAASNHMTIQRLVAAFPDLAAYALKLLDDNGRLSQRVQSEIPNWLCFPAAAALPFAEDHIPALKQMCKDFSSLIGGTFDEGIFDLQRASARPLSVNAVHDYLVSKASESNITLLQN